MKCEMPHSRFDSYRPPTPIHTPSETLSMCGIGAVTLGRASYHVFLTQIVWFGAVPEQSLGRFAAALAIVIAIGVVFYRLVPGRWPIRPSASGLLPDGVPAVVPSPSSRRA